MVTDPIADFLTRIRNAQLAGHTIVDIPASNMKKKINRNITRKRLYPKIQIRRRRSSRYYQDCIEIQS